MQDTNIINDDKLLFLGEENEEAAIDLKDPWRILIVDDEPDVHSMTRMVLGDYVFEGRGLEFFSAYTGEESLEHMRRDKDIAVVLLDVVMETNTAGLEAASAIREDLNNPFVRIILRTGQPGFAPEHKVITELDINDYWQKAEITSQRLATSMTTALRSYRDLRKIEQNRGSLAQLAMSVAHQIRNRTMTINGFANLASRKLEPDSAVIQYLNTISEEAGRLEMIVESVSDFAAISNCEHDRLEVTAVIEELMNEIYEFAERLGKNVDFDVDLKEIMIDAKHNLFKKVLEEILKNAVIFSDAASPRVKLTLKSDSGTCRIEISDNGSGIDEVDYPYIFDPFFTRRPEAVGMGLSIVKRIASGYNWTVDVFRSDDNGALFSIRIPL